MIYTITFNPSLDYIIRVADFQAGSINRTEYEEILPGGKGINVSIVLKNLGLDSIALGFMAGFTGDEICRRVEEHGCRTDFIRIDDGMSRINVKMKSKEETEINGQGPHITDDAIEVLCEKLDSVQSGDILVLAGSIPNSLPEDIYEKIIGRVKERGIQVVIDATRDLLVNVLKYRPFLIKPNNHELSEIFDITIRTKDEVIHYAKKLQDMGARNVLVSMAGEGAVLVAEDGTSYQKEAPKGKLVNSVGAGDSMVAGFLYGYITESDLLNAFHYGIAAGSASAFSDKLAVKQEVLDILRQF